MAKKDLYLEDAVLDTVSEEVSLLEKPLTQRVFLFFGVFLIIFFIIVLVRLISLGVFQYDVYASRARLNAGREHILRAPRGIIVDRFGEALVSNEPTFDVFINVSEALRNESFEGRLEEVSSLIEVPVDTIMEELRSVDLEHQAYITLARDISLSQALAIDELEGRDFVVERGYRRVYPYAEATAHVLGYTSIASKDDLAQNESLLLGDSIGKAGLEMVYDEYVRGENGVSVTLHDAKGEVLGDRIIQKEVTGNVLQTTIDLALQIELYEAMRDQLAVLERRSGGALAINPQTGEVYALVSFPSFDPNNLSSEVFEDPQNPLFNRMISGLYSPGSVIKPLVAFAALEENLIDPMDSIYSAGYIEIPNPYTPSQPSRFVDWKAHGWVNMYSALARSSNIYFYAIGGGFEEQEGLGIDRLHEYWTRFFLDRKTEIDLPGEVLGRLPDRTSKDVWRIGDTYNVSIGQGDVLVTPAAMLRAITTFVTRGQAPYLRVTDQGNIGFDTVPFIDEQHFRIVEEGMIATVTSEQGTAHMLDTIDMTIAAKTGSAQTNNNTKTNAFFVGYAPVENPSLALLILIEDAREGSLNAVPVAKRIFEWYDTHRGNE